MNSPDNVFNYLFKILNNFPDIEKYPNLTILFNQIQKIFHQIEIDFIDIKQQTLKINEIDDVTNEKFFQILTENLTISNFNLNSINNLIIKINQISPKISNLNLNQNSAIKCDFLTTPLKPHFYEMINDLNLIGILEMILELMNCQVCLFIPINSNYSSKTFQLFQNHLTLLKTNLTEIIKAFKIINYHFHEILANFNIPTSTPNRFIN
ncbi:hypothetical protein [Candidatus Phytoplasma pyri]|uniref:hypothetical protein n=1 Tax=Candidatus Phytoplasma pyri TaxID=47566 RepID=UPI0039831328